MFESERPFLQSVPTDTWKSRPADSHAKLGHLKTAYHWDWLGAERGFRRAIGLIRSRPRLTPGTPSAWRAREVQRGLLAAIPRSRELEPLFPVLNSAAARFEYSARRHAGPVGEARKAMEMDPNLPLSNLALGYSHALQPRLGEAKSEFEEALRLSKGGLMAATIAEAGLGCAGERHRARNLPTNRQRLGWSGCPPCGRD